MTEYEVLSLSLRLSLIPHQNHIHTAYHQTFVLSDATLTGLSIFSIFHIDFHSSSKSKISSQERISLVDEDTSLPSSHAPAPMDEQLVARPLSKSGLAPIDAAHDRFPCCLVWTPLPCIRYSLSLSLILSRSLSHPHALCMQSGSLVGYMRSQLGTCPWLWLALGSGLS